MAKKHISVTNKRVLEAMGKSKNASRLIEVAILYYLDSIEKEYITKEEVQSMIFDALKGMEIKNPNYDSQDFGTNIRDILDL